MIANQPPTLSVEEIISRGGDIEEMTDITIGLHEQTPAGRGGKTDRNETSEVWQVDQQTAGTRSI